ncbi:hypothetical protein HK104_005017, partial [Borealophlyctis nickersoniae]
MAQATKTAITGPDAQSTAPKHSFPGDHPSKFTIEVHYSLDKIVVPSHTKELRGRHGEKKKELQPKKRKNAMEDYRKFYVAYSVGGVLEGKSDILSCDALVWTLTHDVTVNTQFIADLYENPVEFSIYEFIRADEYDRLRGPARALQATNSRIDASGSRLGSTVRLHTQRSTGSREASMDALAKRRFLLANPTLPPKERYIQSRRQSIAASQASETRRILEALSEIDDSQIDEEISEKLGKRPGKDGEKIPPKPRSAGALPSRLHPPHPPAAAHKVHAVEEAEQKHPARPGVPEKDAESSDEEEDVPPPTREDNRETRPNIFRAFMERRESFLNKDTPHPHHYAVPERHGVVPIKNSLIRPADLDFTRAIPEERIKPKQQSKKHTAGGRDEPPAHSKPSKQNRPSSGSEIMKKKPAASPDHHHTDLKRTKKKPSRQQHPDDAPDPDHFPTVDLSELLTRPRTNPQPQQQTHAKPERRYTAADTTSIKKREGKKGEHRHVLVAKVLVDVTELFLGDTNVSATVEERIEGMLECRVGIKLDSPLLSAPQLESLNPMCITLLEAEGMPSNPIPYTDLNQQCQQVFARFRFFSDPHIHQSVCVNARAKTLVFGTRHLILPGLMDEDGLRDDLVNGGFLVEVHDRDYKLPEDLSKVSHEITSDGSIKAMLNPKNPFGVATF